MKTVLTTRGFDEYLDKLAKAGKDIDPIADEALDAGSAVLETGMLKRAPELPGHLKSKIGRRKITDGNYHAVEIGIQNVDRETELYFFYQEMGSAHAPAHPYLRPTFDHDRSKARNEMKRVFVERGAI